MHNPHRAVPMAVAALLLAAVLVVGDALAAPAHAISRRAVVPSAISRRPHSAYLRRTVRRPVRRTSRRRMAIRSVPVPVPAAGDVWARLRQCESEGRYDISTGNGYYGAYQFKLSTWQGLGYPGYPHQAPAEMQDEAAQKLQARSGWGQWPACSRRIGAR